MRAVAASAKSDAVFGRSAQAFEYRPGRRCIFVGHRPRAAGQQEGAAEGRRNRAQQMQTSIQGHVFGGIGRLILLEGLDKAVVAERQLIPSFRGRRFVSVVMGKATPVLQHMQLLSGTITAVQPTPIAPQRDCLKQHR